MSGAGAAVAWAPGEQPAVASAILELFHLLPNQTSAKFMETEGPPMPYSLNPTSDPTNL